MFGPNTPHEVQSVVDTLVGAGWHVKPTGSRVICPEHCREDSDWDLMLLDVEPFKGEPLMSLFRDLDWSTGTCRIGCVNIVLLTAACFKAWLVATELCSNHPKGIERDFRVFVFKECMTDHGVKGVQYTDFDTAQVCE